MPNTTTQSDQISSPFVLTSDSGESGEDWSANPIDVFVLENKFAQWVLPRVIFQTGKDDLQIKVETGFRMYMLSSCDIQMITGLGILISAFSTLGGSSGISAYHWQIVVYLAWFANLTPLLGLTFLRQHLQMHPFQRSWRLVLMAIIFVLLLVALFPTGYFDWSMPYQHVTDPGSFAWCYLNYHFIKQLAKENDEAIPGETGSTMALSMALLIFTCTTRLLKMSRRASRFIRQRARRRARNIGLRMMEHASRGLQIPTQHPRLDMLRISLVLQPMAAFLLTARLYMDFYASTASEIWWAWVTTVWVSIRIFQSKMSAEVKEGDLTFGQVMAVLLLIAPMITAGVALQSIWEQLIQRQRNSSSSPRQQETSAHESNGDCIQTTACESPASGLPLATVEDNRNDIRRPEYMIALVRSSSTSYAQPWSSAVATMMWIQISLTTLSFILMTSGLVFGNLPSAVWFLRDGAIAMILQPLNCSLLILAGMHCMPSKVLRINRLRQRANGTLSVPSHFLQWSGDLFARTMLVLSLVGGVIFTSPLPNYFAIELMYLPLPLICLWILYFICTVIRTAVSPTR